MPQGGGLEVLIIGGLGVLLYCRRMQVVVNWWDCCCTAGVGNDCQSWATRAMKRCDEALNASLLQFLCQR
jgi:hypothetical protein